MNGSPDRHRRDPALVRLERLERLQGLTEALSAAATREEVARIIFDRGLGLLDASAIALFWETPQGDLELVHGVGLSSDFARRFARVPSDEPLPSAAAYRTGAPVWLASRDEIAAQFPEVLDLSDREGTRAWAALPLVSDRSRGALSLRFESPHAFDGEERGFVTSIARQCSQALDRARLFDAQKELAERLRSLLSTSAALAAAATPPDVAAAAFRALGVLGACAAEIHAFDGPERLALIARHGRGADDGTAPVPLDAPEPAAEVVRTGRALWIESAHDVAGRYPALETGRALGEEGAWAVVPLLASGKTLGALTVAFPRARRLDPDDRIYIRLVAQPCAQALERARLFAEAGRSRTEAEWNAALLGALCGSAPVGLALLDREMRFVRVNGLFARVDGLDATAHAGRTPLEVLRGFPGEQIADAFRTVLETGSGLDRIVSGEPPTTPGTTRTFATSWYPVRVHGELVGVGVVVRDGDEGLP